MMKLMSDDFIQVIILVYWRVIIIRYGYVMILRTIKINNSFFYVE